MQGSLSTHMPHETRLTAAQTTFVYNTRLSLIFPYRDVTRCAQWLARKKHTWKILA